MDNPKNPPAVAFDGITDLAFFWIRHPVSHSVVKNNRLELLDDKDPRESVDFFCETFVMPVLEDDISGDEWVEFVDEELKLKKEGKLDYPSLQSLYYLVIALAYYSQAIKSEDNQNSWFHVAEGKYWHGRLVGVTQEHNLEIIKNSDKANDARHKDNRAAKEIFLAWWKEQSHEYPSQKAALLTATQKFERGKSTLERYLKDL